MMIPKDTGLRVVCPEAPGGVPPASAGGFLSTREKRRAEARGHVPEAPRGSDGDDACHHEREFFPHSAEYHSAATWRCRVALCTPPRRGIPPASAGGFWGVRACRRPWFTPPEAPRGSDGDDGLRGGSALDSQKVRGAADARIIRADQVLAPPRGFGVVAVEHGRQIGREVRLDAGLVLRRGRNDRGRGDEAVGASFLPVATMTPLSMAMASTT